MRNRRRSARRSVCSTAGDGRTRQVDPDATSDAASADGTRCRRRVRDATNVAAFNISLDARGDGSIGIAADDLDIDSRTGGILFAQAAQNAFITEVNGELDVLAARALGGELRLTVPDTSAPDTENLVLLANGSARVQESGDTTVSLGEITAFTTAALWVGDNVSTNANSRIAAGAGITIRGDSRRVGKTNAVDDTNADPGRGTQMDLRGTIGLLGAPADPATPTGTTKTFTEIYGHIDIDTLTFNQTKLDANTSVFGSQRNNASIAHDGEDQFIVNQLRSMHVDRNGVGDTLTLDGQSDTDYYVVNTTGSEVAAADRHNYVINVLDTGAKDNGVDELAIRGADSMADVFLLRSMTAIPSETAESPAFVALLHGSLADAMAGTGPSQVERINYDANLNGRLTVEGLGGNDYFAVDDNSAITTLDGGAGDDTFQIGQIFGSQRNALAISPDRRLRLRDRGDDARLSQPRDQRPAGAEGGSGNDVFRSTATGAGWRAMTATTCSSCVPSRWPRPTPTVRSRPTSTAWRWSRPRAAVRLQPPNCCTAAPATT